MNAVNILQRYILTLPVFLTFFVEHVRLRASFDALIALHVIGLLQLRFEHDTTSYEELCAFEQ